MARINLFNTSGHRPTVQKYYQFGLSGRENLLTFAPFCFFFRLSPKTVNIGF
jgi:hypothetical protein